MYYLYVIQSERGSHFYIGASGDLVDRLNRHNKGFSKATKPYKPWCIIYTETYESKTEAMKREYFLKSPQGYQEKKLIFEQYKII